MTGDSRLVELLLELARLDGRSGKEKPVAEYVIRFLRRLGLSAAADGTRGRTGSDTGNVIARYKGGGDFALLAHMDSARSTKDTRAIVSSRRIASDGNGQLGVDDRAGIAAILHAVETAMRRRPAVKPFTAAFTSRCAWAGRSGRASSSIPPSTLAASRSARRAPCPMSRG